ncbi:malto-oligosyltrehalose synthase [Bordetella genomosp. 13]|uniref:malto-oligosyltrehalose synthase n=1 Tax=Bordetella genomosp. 13 TaxID=463040 RepID=UPI0011A90248|nr:malto-oligosyltrehalose synthase [Bordetella genomosp. 13]
MSRPHRDGAPRATVRLQLHKDFTLDDAREQVDYYAGLGISHFYLSPVTRARPGSTHGYDVVDHGQVNPELGGEPALRALADALHARGMGILLDIVPNHMATHWDNAWWRDVLAHGRHSAYADWFDIDWHDPDPWLTGRLLAPTLGRPYLSALQNGDIRLAWDEATQGYVVDAGGRYPVAPGTLDARGGREAVLAAHDPDTDAGRAALHALLDRQHYRLAWWPTAADQINWRRFFEISDLAGVRVDRPEVHAAVHALVLRLYAEGVIDGVRIDHIDGLAQPAMYCRRLRADLRRAGQQGGRTQPEPYVVVEKILAEDEALPVGWQTDGTTGYDFMEDINAALHDAAGTTVLEQGWQAFSGDVRTPAEQLEAARRLMLARHFSAENAALVRVLARLARLDPSTCDCPPQAISRALVPWLVAFPVYRTYGEGGSATRADLAYCQVASQRARQIMEETRQEPDEAADRIAERLLGWLALPPGQDDTPESARLRRRAQNRLRHLTPPLAAKALEDTYFYRRGTLLSRNEVGASPYVAALDAQQLHERLIRRAQAHPQALLATATHDHKRGEDVRTRLAVLTEMPQQWLEFAGSWVARAGVLDGGAQEAGRPVPQPADLYMLLQTLVGAWPAGLEATDVQGVNDFCERVRQWQTKALREAKLGSNWYAPDEAYEAACGAVLDALIQATGDAHAPSRPLLAGVAQWARRLTRPGMLNGLVQATVRLTAPGVPDLYQGADRWDFSLVDPDNRRPVDYAARQSALAQSDTRTLDLADATIWQDGRVKQALVHRLLALRAERAELRRGTYQPLAVEGVRAEHVIAYARRGARGLTLVIAARACAARMSGATQADGATGGEARAAGQAWWQDTRIVLPASLAAGALQDALGGKALPVPSARSLPVDMLLEDWPVAVLISR